MVFIFSGNCDNLWGPIQAFGVLLLRALDDQLNSDVKFVIAGINPAMTLWRRMGSNERPML